MEDNVLIAEFMELKVVNVTPDKKEVITYLHPFDGGYVNLDDMLYMDSRDWLMPVVEKIFSLGYDYTIKPRHMIIKERMGEIVSECIGLYQSQEEVIYQAVVEFIKKYNHGRM